MFLILTNTKYNIQLNEFELLMLLYLYDEKLFLLIQSFLRKIMKD